MVTGDNPLTAAAIAAEAGVDDFLAEATPEAKLALIRKEQEGGQLVAMMGDGTNDAPALAQADVGVAMNAGTQAAKEAGNMVDLDSNPTKLLDVVEIGKQLLITRGALTTFSIANDLAKYFAIIPAMFVDRLPAARRRSTSSHLRSPESAILSAVIFNALIIIALDPDRAARRALPPAAAAALLRRNVADLRPRRRHRAVRRHQAHRHPHLRRGVLTWFATSVRSIVSLLALTVLFGGAFPVVVWAIGQVGVRGPRRRLADPSATAASSARPCSARASQARQCFQPRLGRRLRRQRIRGSNLGPNTADLAAAVKERLAAAAKENGIAQARAGRPRDRVGLGSRPRW